jgi:pentatricopeptide repeat protein
MKAQGLEPTQETFGSLMESYSKTPNPGPRVQKLLDELENKYSEGEISLPPPKVSYLMAIRAWGRTKPGGAKKAESLVRRLEEVCSQQDSGWAKLQPCTILYTALVSAWAQSDDDFAPDRARDLFREMLQMAKSGRRNVAPNAVTLNAVLEAFCNQGRIDEAREFLANAKRVVRPDSKSYLTILKAYANSEASNAAEKAEEFLVGLEDEYHRGEGVTKPTIRMYSQVLVAWGNSMKPGATFRAEELFWKLLKQEIDGIDVVPDTTTLNCVLRAWSKSSEGGAAERAEALLQKVRDEHSDVISIDPISHLHLIYAWAHSRRRRAPKEAEKHLERARELCCSGNHSDSGLTRAHFNGTILAWKKSNHSNAACQIRKLQRERDQKTQNSKM